MKICPPVSFRSSVILDNSMRIFMLNALAVCMAVCQRPPEESGVNYKMFFYFKTLIIIGILENINDYRFT